MVRQRVLVFNNMLAPYTRRLYDEVTTQGLELHVLSCCSAEPNRNWGDPWRPGESPRFSQRVLRGVSLRLAENRFAHLNFSIGRTLSEIKPDLLVLNGFYPSMLIGERWAMRSRIPLALTNDGWRNTMPDTIYHRLVRSHIIGRCRAVAVCSDKGREYFGGEIAITSALFTVPLVPAWDHAGPIVDFERRPFDLLWVAHMNDAVKNFSFFVDAAIALRARKPDLRVRLVGTGSAAMAGMARLRMAGIDLLHEPDKPWWKMEEVYDSARVLVLPSLWEPWGLVCNEAMQSGTPCIVSPVVGAADELVRDARNGFVLPIQLNRWVDRLETIVADKQLWQSLSENSVIDVAVRTVERSAKAFIDMVSRGLAVD